MANEFNVKRVAKATINCAGAAGTYSSDVLIPAGAVVTNLYITEDVAFAGGTNMKVAVGSTDLTDVVLTASVATGTIALDSSATAIKLAATGKLNIVTTGTFTGGTATVYVEYAI